MRLFLALAAFAGLAAAAPLSSLEVRDAVCAKTSGRNIGTYSKPCSTYASALTCPNGIQGKKNGVVLLVHGTGSTGPETWGNGPYLKLLPDEGFDVCYVTLPNRSLGDIQTTSEYIAYLIHLLAPQSATGKVGLVTHSQGGLNAQFALDFWPEMRALTSSFVALAAPFRGTAEGVPACLVLGLVTGGCNPSVIQQTVGSQFLDALNARGNVALVPTTSIYTAYDDVIQPELILPTSRLSGAEVVRLQDKCSDAYVMEHFGIPFSSYAYALAVDALKSRSTANVNGVQASSCAWVLDDYLLDNFKRGPSVLKQAVNDILAVVTGTKVKKEPALKPYICARGDMKSGCSSS
ncbi:hypothetical protein JCM6882_005548 [Rhodosporidiobolus microsporus]